VWKNSNGARLARHFLAVKLFLLLLDHSYKKSISGFFSQLETNEYNLFDAPHHKDLIMIETFDLPVGLPLS
jgi:hypothetical protein